MNLIYCLYYEKHLPVFHKEQLSGYDFYDTFDKYYVFYN